MAGPYDGYANDRGCFEYFGVFGRQKNIEGMKRFGITSSSKILGVPKPKLRELAKKIGKNHELALRLWDSNIHEARILASMIAEPEKVDEDLMERWVKDFDNWDLCDQCVMNLFWRMKFAYKKAVEWSQREEEFVRRAGFALMAKLAISDKKANDEKFERFFPYILKGAKDERNYVKKAVSWALRQIGKRNLYLNKKAIELAEEIKKLRTKSAKYIATETLRELRSEKVQRGLSSKERGM